MTIRLPDVSAPSGLGREIGRAVDDTLADVAPATGTATLDAAEYEVPSTPPAANERRPSPLAHPLVETCAAYVRQPKFWLACIVAVAVQVLLAAVMTPADGDREQLAPRQTSAKQWSKPAAAPATRIVVPPAQTPGDAEPAEGLKNGTTTPLGVTVPMDGLSDMNGPTGQASGDAEPLELLTPPTRMADIRRLADAAAQFDGRNGQSHEGATLGAIVPLEPIPETNRNEQP
jgi:hypothetical protein